MHHHSPMSGLRTQVCKCKDCKHTQTNRQQAHILAKISSFLLQVEDLKEHGCINEFDAAILVDGMVTGVGFFDTDFSPSARSH